MLGRTGASAAGLIAATKAAAADGWNDRPAQAPEQPGQRHGVRPPTRGRLLRDKYVLRLIAIDRAVHFLALAAIGLVVVLFAAHRTQFQGAILRVVSAFQGTESATLHDSGHGVVHWIVVLTHLSPTSLQVTTVAVWAYAVLELVEAFGLWWARRWAEYLTLLATSALLPLEVFEVLEKVTWLRGGALAINLAIVGYLLVAKRLFGLRGGAPAEHRARLADSGWLPLERATPPHHGATAAPHEPRSGSSAPTVPLLQQTQPNGARYPDAAQQDTAPQSAQGQPVSPTQPIAAP